MSKSNFEKPARLLPTPRQVEGPYFLLDSPRRTHMAPKGAQGKLYNLNGAVLGTDGQPIRNATIHVWLADPEGKYDNQDAKGNPLDLSPSEHLYRGRVKSDSLLSGGAYSFSFLRPGNYPISNDGLEARPAHVHVLVEAEGYSELITQLYFLDDPYNLLDIKGDDFFQPELVMHSFRIVLSSTELSIFNFVLRKLIDKPNAEKTRKTERETNINYIIVNLLTLAFQEYGQLQNNMKTIAELYEDAAHLGIGMSRLTQMANHRLAQADPNKQIRLENKKITGRDNSDHTAHWRFHSAELVVSARQSDDSPPTKERAALKFSTLEAI